MEVVPLNHHAIIYRHNANSKLVVQYQPNPGLTLDIFLFLVTTLNNFLCHTTPRHSALSIHQMDRADTLGRIAPIPAHSRPIPWRFSVRQVLCFLFSEVFCFLYQASNSPLPMNPTPTDFHTGSRIDSPHILNSPPTHTSSTFSAPSISLVLRRSQLFSPSHNLVIPLPIISTRQFRCEKIELI